MPDIAANLNYLRKQVPPSVKLVAVSKTKPVETLMTAYDAGQRIFGENRVQEILDKKGNLPSDIQWHMIGHLQTNKVKFIIPFISLIHSVDSFRLLSVIDGESKKTGRITECLLQIHIAEEETKTGFLLNEIIEAHEELSKYRNVKLRGVMGMATFTQDTDQVRKEFRYLAECFDILKNRFFNSGDEFSEISMGMSGDYMIAIEEGSTMIRVGSLIFGERNLTTKNNG
ncbi:MAG TPA: YggS family pyridoxal phosphate-dependent enzyme [Bacteroidales bacterium]|nr:YggS family pyridoxal phosphate-dependent enzyme [Bacteroidales bacterium]